MRNILNYKNTLKTVIVISFFIPNLVLGALTDGLVSYWSFDESSGNATDIHGSNDAINTNSTAFSTGILNNGADLESSSSNYFYVGDTADLSITGDLTIVTWIKKETTIDGAQLFTKRTGTGNQRSYGLGLTTGGMDWAVSDDGGAMTSAGITTTLTTGTWYQIAIVYDASAGEVSFYKDGTQTGTTQGGLDTTIFNSTSDFCIGCLFAPAQDFYDGMIDESGIWNRTLSETEIEDLYNNGTPLAYPFITQAIYGCTEAGNLNYNPSATLDDNSCYRTATTTIETIANTTNFGLAIIISILSMFLIGMIYNSLNRKKRWKK